ncbi:DCL family protein [Pseudomonas syringae pv. syringae]|nr:DCL family protein [Pseudomonas syringae]MCH5509683.1 DCL family protein [Pseudomonas syringae pv. syringae]MCH5638139.1 DCL family protein [Pseudomonas syringae pv. syringae]MCH7429973.1 DCL family protein [Pseudomonas syringae pv. syringae]
MLNRYDVGDRVSVSDAVILRAALENHPKATEKIGCGIADFSVRSADFGTKCFWVNRTDGTTEKFSIKGSIHVS